MSFFSRKCGGINKRPKFDLHIHRESRICFRPELLWQTEEMRHLIIGGCIKLSMGHRTTCPRPITSRVDLRHWGCRDGENKKAVCSLSLEDLTTL